MYGGEKMITKVYISFDIEELRKINKKDLMEYMKKNIVEAVKKDIDKKKIKLHIELDEHRLKAGYIIVYTTFELNLEVEE